MEIKTNVGNLKLVFSHEKNILKAITEWEEQIWLMEIPEHLGPVPLVDYTREPYCIDCVDLRGFFFIFSTDRLISVDKDNGESLTVCVPGFLDKEGLNFYKSFIFGKSVIVVTTKKILVFNEQGSLSEEVFIDGLVKSGKIKEQELILEYYDLSDTSLPLSKKTIDFGKFIETKNPSIN